MPHALSYMWTLMPSTPKWNVRVPWECAKPLAHTTRTCTDARVCVPRSQPLAVQQWTGLIAVNYPARAAGIGRLDTATSAKARCAEVHVRFA